MLNILVLAAAIQSPQLPPLRQLDRAEAVSRDSMTAVTAAVEVAGGGVMVNDIIGRRVLLYDSTLARAVVVADSEASAVNAYGARPGTLMPYRGDSALFITPSSMSMLVLSPSGEITRVMAMPSGGGGVGALIGSIFGTPGFDARGRLVYFSPVSIQRMRVGGPAQEGPTRMEPPDSAFVVRWDLAARTLDTAAVIRIPRSRSTMERNDQGQIRMTMVAFPPTTVDDWAVTSDGRVAVVRGRDYHVDWLSADGTWTSTPRMHFAWERLSDEAKTALVDSVQSSLQAMIDSSAARIARGEVPGAAGAQRSGPGGAAPAGGAGPTVMVFSGPAGGGGPAPSGGGPRPATQMAMTTPTVVRADLADVPDYRPAFSQGAVRADRDGNLWIRTSKVENGRPIYDVVNSRGELIDRVQFPANRTIAGFGRGVVYLGVRDENGVAHLERVRIR